MRSPPGTRPSTGRRPRRRCAKPGGCASGQLLRSQRADPARPRARRRGRRPERPRRRVAARHGASCWRSGRPVWTGPAPRPPTKAARLARAEVRCHAPVPDPPSILAIGMNYRAHVAEMGREPPEWQYWFNKQRTAVAGPGDPIVLPTVSDAVDYEGELALVIGPRCQHVPAARALEVVAGYTVINDVSARDWQWRSPTFTMGKSFDSHAPCGPELVTGDEVGDPGNLGLRTWVNDELRQDSTTADLIFGCAAMIEYLTTAFPLEPGTIIATGTPAGVGAGFRPAPVPGRRRRGAHRHRGDRRAGQPRRAGAEAPSRSGWRSPPGPGGPAAVRACCGCARPCSPSPGARSSESRPRGRGSAAGRSRPTSCP